MGGLIVFQAEFYSPGQRPVFVKLEVTFGGVLEHTSDEEEEEDK